MITWLEYERTYRGYKNPYKKYVENNPDAIRNMKKSKRSKIKAAFKRLHQKLEALQEVRQLVAIAAIHSGESKEFLVNEALEVFQDNVSALELLDIKQFIESGL